MVDEVGYGKLDAGRATALCRAAFESRGLEPARIGELSVAAVDLGTIKNLNLDFRGVDGPTDVLSFTMDGPYGEMVGEIVVAPEYVDSEPRAVEELVVHGALHLSGMEHGEDFDGSEMARAQAEVLESVREKG